LTTLSSRTKRSVSHRAIARRARLIAWTKRVLPAIALVLLAMVIMWPEFSRLSATGGAAVTAMDKAEALGGDLRDAHYRGVDEHGEPYTVTASAGQQVSAERVNLTNPKADIVLQNGHWLMLQADHGVYMQHSGLLDVSGHVVVYRDDGLFLYTSVATLDLKTGFASSTHLVSVEGPFGTIDATGFAGADKGAMLQFSGPARLLMNARP
jgi:lipopolysaccharide export system protein LptC